MVQNRYDGGGVGSRRVLGAFALVCKGLRKSL